MEVASRVSKVPNKLSPFSTLFKSTWQIYRSRIVVFSEIMLFPFIFTLIVYFATASGVLVPATGFWRIFIVAFLTLVNIFLQLLAYAAIIHCTKDNPGLIDSLKSALRKFLPFLAVILLAGLISLIGFGLLVIPGVIVTVWLSLAAFTLIFEEQKVVASLLRSKELVRGNFFPVLLRLLAAWSIVVVISVLILLPVYLLGRIDPSYVSQSDLTALVSRVQIFDALNFSLSNLINVFTTPLVVVFGVQIYHDLKRFEGE